MQSTSAAGAAPGVPGKPCQLSAGRGFDLLLASAALVVFSPLYCGLPLLIFLEDRGPVFFRQSRRGLNGRPFEILKFRTMKGQQVTRVGRWLRKTGLDETAQFLNVFRGQMSVVGPRPLTEEDIARLGWGGPRFEDRWKVRPGITGLGQIFGGRSARHSLRLEGLYVRRKSWWFDLRLVAISFAINLFGKRPVRALLRAAGNSFQ